MAHEQGVCGLDDDQVFDSTERDQPSIAENDIVAGIVLYHLAAQCISILIVPEVIRKRGPGADIIPIEGRLECQDLRGLLHDRIVHRDLWKFREALGEVASRIARGKVADEFAERRSQAFGFTQKNLGSPYKHAGVPSVLSAPIVSLGSGKIRLFDKANDIVNRVVALAEMQVSESRSPGRWEGSQK